VKILNLEPGGYSPKAKAILDDVAEHILWERDGLDSAEVIITRLGYQVNREFIDSAPNLKAIVTATTGLDHIDLDAAKARGVDVLSLQGEADFLSTIPATAEHTWTLLMALVRRVPWAFDDVKAGRWNRDSWRGTELKGKTICIVGAAGRVGAQVGRYAKVFGMTVFARDTKIGYTDVHPCDILTLHVPLSKETRGMVGVEQIARTNYLINTSRGEIVDEDALLEALKSGQLGGAALDVMTDERGKRNQSLLEYARQETNLIITPHIAGATHESMEKCEIFVASKLKRWIEGQE